MKLHETLKKLKNVNADSAYTRRSRAHLMELHRAVHKAPMSPLRFFFNNLLTGSAIALTGLILVLGLGSASSWQFLSPFRLSSLDIASLRAEAEAINNIQVELSSIAYTESPSHETTTVVTGKTLHTPKDIVMKKAAPAVTSSVPENSNASSGEPLTIDETLDILAE